MVPRHVIHPPSFSSVMPSTHLPYTHLPDTFSYRTYLKDGRCPSRHLYSCRRGRLYCHGRRLKVGWQTLAPCWTSRQWPSIRAQLTYAIASPLAFAIARYSMPRRTASAGNDPPRASSAIADTRCFPASRGFPDRELTKVERGVATQSGQGNSSV